MPHFEVHGWWTVSLRDERGRLLLAPTDDGHTMRPLTWVAAVRAHVAHGDCLHARSTRAGFPYLALQDAFGELIATSPLFAHDAEGQRALHFLRNTVGSAQVVHVPDGVGRVPLPGARAIRLRRHGEPGRFLELLQPPTDRERALASPSDELTEARWRVHGNAFVALETEAGGLLLRTLRLADASACLHTIDDLRRLAARHDGFDRYQTPYRGHAFAIRGRGRDPLACSPVYCTESNRERAIEIVRSVAPTAPLLDAVG